MRDIFSKSDASLITRIHLSHLSRSDKLIWCDSAIGMFTVKSAYFVARNVLGKVVHHQEQRHGVWRIIWMSKVIPKIKYFAWRMAQGIIPTSSGLQRRGLQVDNRCSVCGHQGETFRHIFFECRFGIAVSKLFIQKFCKQGRTYGRICTTGVVSLCCCRSKIWLIYGWTLVC